METRSACCVWDAMNATPASNANNADFMLRVLFGAQPQLRCERAFGHHGKVALNAGRTHDEGILLANLSLHCDQPRLGVGTVIFTVIGENYRSTCIGGCFGDLLLR